MPSKKWRWAVLAVCAAAFVAAIGEQAVLQHGQESFARLGCASCHANGGGPNLARVEKKYDSTTLVRFIQDPEQVYRERGQKPLNPGYVGMHKVKASAWEIRTIATYLRNISD
jgi:mono/diheme cytochrome c family protein